MEVHHLTQKITSSIAYMSAVDMTNCRMLRSYDSRHSTYNPTIIEAISIAWATPGLFSSVRVGSEFALEELISGVDGFNNPTFQAVKEAHEIFGSNMRMGCLLSLGAGKPLLRSTSIDRQDLLQRTVRDTEVIVEQMRRRYAGLRVYFRLSVDRDLTYGNASTPFEKRLGRIISLTAAYLETHDAFTVMDRCVKSSRKASRVTIDHLCEYSSIFILIACDLVSCRSYSDWWSTLFPWPSSAVGLLCYKGPADGRYHQFSSE